MFFSFLFSLLLPFGFAQDATAVEKNSESDIYVKTIKIGTPSNENLARFDFKLDRSLNNIARRVEARTFIPSSLSDADFKKEKTVLEVKAMLRCTASGAITITSVPVAIVLGAVSGLADSFTFVTEYNRAYQEAEKAGDKMTLDQRQFWEHTRANRRALENTFKEQAGLCEKVALQLKMYSEEARRRGLQTSNADYTFGGNGNAGP